MEDGLTLFYDFDSFRLDLNEGTLLHEGRQVQLTQRAYEALLLLIRNRDRVVDKDELLNALWPDSDVEENNLNQLISALRKALGDRRRQGYIKTVPKRGYRFVADVTEVSGDDAGETAERPGAEPGITDERGRQNSNGEVEGGNAREWRPFGGPGVGERRRGPFKILAVVGAGLLFLALAYIAVRVAMKPRGLTSPAGEPTGHAQPHREKVEVEVWWPKDGTKLSGTQTFKAIATNLSLPEYNMYWQVDGDRLNPLANNYEEYPHKEILVDLSGWNWRGNGPYKVNFVAKEANGSILAERSVVIYVAPE